MNKLQNSILKTLVYHDIFDYPLTQKEIWKFLLLNSKFKIQNYLDDLIRKQKVFIKDNFYFLPNREEIIEIRQKREKYSQEKLKKAKKLAKLLRFIPWVKMIGITGALAMSNACEEDDIDFLIITDQDRPWLTRFLMIIFLEILGKRRRPKAKKVKDIKDKICLNMFLDETTFQQAQAKKNLFTAHEICQMKPIFDRNNSYERFLWTNRWVKKYLPNGIQNLEPRIKNQGIISKSSRRPESKALSSMLLFLEKLAYQLQLKYMKSKRTSEDISPHFAFFHPGNQASLILKRYKQKLKQTKQLY